MRTPRTCFPFIINPYPMEYRTEKILSKIAELESALAVFTQLPRQDHSDKQKEFLNGLIPILDSMDAIKRAVAESGIPEWENGFNLFYDKLNDYFESFHFKILAEPGMAFNPTHHEAVGSTPGSQDYPPGKIADIIQQGWIYKGKVLRFAKVIVSK